MRVLQVAAYLSEEAKAGKKTPRTFLRWSSSRVSGLYQRMSSLATSFWLKMRPLISSLAMPSAATSRSRELWWREEQTHAVRDDPTNGNSQEEVGSLQSVMCHRHRISIYTTMPLFGLNLTLPEHCRRTRVQPSLMV